jgi:hypothetical protein
MQEWRKIPVEARAVVTASGEIGVALCCFSVGYSLGTRAGGVGMREPMTVLYSFLSFRIFLFITFVTLTRLFPNFH